MKNAIAFGATGVGLCRTEHMFFEGDRIDSVRQMILADNEAARRKAIKKLLPYQRKDFEGIFKALNGLPGTIRLLDPPLHEFLPHDSKQIADLAKKLKVKPSEIKQRVDALFLLQRMFRAMVTRRRERKRREALKLIRVGNFLLVDNIINDIEVR